MNKQLQYLVLDLECNNNIPDPGRKVPRGFSGNKIVMHGMLHSLAPSNTIVLKNLDATNTFYEDLLEYTELVIGHNIKYDLHYLRFYYPAWEAWLNLPTSKVWDTQTVQYLITAQADKMISLEKALLHHASISYLSKEDGIKELWEQGINTEDIPEKDLSKYLRQDVRITHALYQQQKEIAIVKVCLPLITSQMESYLATTDMEYNGMHFDIKKCKKHAEQLKLELKVRKEIISQELGTMFVSPDPLSNKQISLYLFGGEWKCTEGKEPIIENGEIVRYKTGLKKGQIKKKKTTINYINQGLYIPKPTWKLKAKHLHCTDISVLKDLYEIDNNPFITKIIELRDIQKQLKTYFEGYLKLVYPNNIIHHNLNTCITATGRLSSSKPNLQNVSN